MACGRRPTWISLPARLVAVEIGVTVPDPRFATKTHGGPHDSRQFLTARRIEGPESCLTLRNTGQNHPCDTSGSTTTPCAAADHAQGRSPSGVCEASASGRFSMLIITQREHGRSAAPGSWPIRRRSRDIHQRHGAGHALE